MKCENCVWSEKFKPRPDEKFNMGCKKPGWEGYTKNEDPSCGGVFFVPKEKNKMQNNG